MNEFAGYSLKKKLLAAGAILAVTAIWGSSFVVMKTALDLISPLWFLAIRFLLAGTLLLLWQGRRVMALGKEGLHAALLVGIPLALGYALQTIGLMRTTASNTALLTGIYVVFVPLIAWIFTRKLNKYQLIVAFFTIGGLCLLTLNEQLQIRSGDIWVVVSAICFAVHFLVLDKYSKLYPSPLLTAMQISVAAVLLLISAVLLEPLPGAANFVPQVLATLVYTAIFATVLAFMAQTAAQRILPPATAAVLFTAESLFGAIFGVWLLGDSFIPRQIVGGAVMLLCMVVSVLNEEAIHKAVLLLKRIGGRPDNTSAYPRKD